MDYKIIRKATIEMSGLTNVDDEYTFYYDETNNSRVFRITEEDFNSSKNEDFVLGGLVCDGKDRTFSMETLMKKLRLQPTLKEIKRKHIAPGDTFLKCMESKKLQVVLEWIIKNKIYIHFMAMNNLYYGVVDIVDSLIAEDSFRGLTWEYITFMKNVLYKYINYDIENVHDIFLYYGYPNIKDVVGFCEVFLLWIDSLEAEDEEDDFGLEFLRQLFKSARRRGELCFLADNEDLMLMESYDSLYVEPIYLYPNSKHVFDEETEVQKRMASGTIELDGECLTNYIFVKSTEEQMLQLSDVIVGIIGKLMVYANASTITDIVLNTINLSEQQQKNIMLLDWLLKDSEKRCKSFIRYTANLIEWQKVKLIFKIPEQMRERNIQIDVENV